jgi:hypothetical protein
MANLKPMHSKRNQKSFRIRFTLTLALAVLSILSSLPVFSQGNLLVMPRRVVFEGGKKSQDLVLANNGKETAKYVVSIIQYRMTDNGNFEKITEPDPGQFFADEYLRFYPRTVELKPNESQVVKMQLSKTEKLEPGEYRSHVYFRAIPVEKPLGEEEARRDSADLSVRLVPVFGITIPVLIRIGANDAAVNMSDLVLTAASDTVNQLKFTFNRSGKMSVYGDVEVRYTGSNGKPIVVGEAKGVAVYTPNKTRYFQMNLRKTAGVDFRSGKLTVVFNPQADSKTSKPIEAELQLH